MNTHFSILPWEYRGARFSPEAHAQTELEVGGKKRYCLLKVREGVIYFKESNRAPIFAVTKQFERELSGDELIETWKAEVAHNNYGRMAWRPLFSTEVGASTVVVAFHRSDFSGWLGDAFSLDWRKTPAHRNKRQLDLWAPRLALPTWRAITREPDWWVERSMPESERQPIESRWIEGEEDELRRLFALVMRLYVRRSGRETTRTWSFEASNPASRGGFNDTFSPIYHTDLTFSPRLKPILQLIEDRFVWTAMEWITRGQGQNQIWGASWRGNFSMKTPQIQITVPLFGHLSHHEKLESLLELRDWLADKIPPKQSARLLADALK